MPVFCQTPLATEDEPADHGYSGLAQQALAEILACDKGAAARPYVSALLKLLLGLPLKLAPQASIKALRVLAGDRTCTSNVNCTLLFRGDFKLNQAVAKVSEEIESKPYCNLDNLQ